MGKELKPALSLEEIERRIAGVKNNPEDDRESGLDSAADVAAFRAAAAKERGRAHPNPKRGVR